MAATLANIQTGSINNVMPVNIAKLDKNSDGSAYTEPTPKINTGIYKGRLISPKAALAFFMPKVKDAPNVLIMLK